MNKVLFLIFLLFICGEEYKFGVKYFFKNLLSFKFLVLYILIFDFGMKNSNLF